MCRRNSIPYIDRLELWFLKIGNEKSVQNERWVVIHLSSIEDWTASIANSYLLALRQSNRNRKRKNTFTHISHPINTYDTHTVLTENEEINVSIRLRQFILHIVASCIYGIVQCARQTIHKQESTQVCNWVKHWSKRTIININRRKENRQNRTEQNENRNEKHPK